MNSEELQRLVFAEFGNLPQSTQTSIVEVIEREKQASYEEGRQYQVNVDANEKSDLVAGMLRPVSEYHKGFTAGVQALAEEIRLAMDGQMNDDTSYRTGYVYQEIDAAVEKLTGEK